MPGLFSFRLYGTGNTAGYPVNGDRGANFGLAGSQLIERFDQTPGENDPVRFTGQVAPKSVRMLA